MSTVNPVNNDYSYYAQTAGVENVENSGNEEFSQLLQEALDELNKSQAMNMANAAMGSGLDGMGIGSISGTYMPSMTNTFEQAIMKASTTGDNNDAMMALLMLMMMMESGSSGGGGGDMSMMMQMMAGLVEQMQDKDTLRNDFLYSSGANPYTLDTIDSGVFGYNHRIPDITGTREADLPLAWWRPTTPYITSNQFERHPALYRAVVDQFNVETAERYRPGREGHTFCNIYVWDVTRAMGAELPLYSDPVTGAPMEYPDIKGANNNGAIAMDRWLKTHGAAYGWRQVSAEQAQYHANSGRPAVTAAADVGHVQMVVPSQDGLYDPVRGVTIAQAGSKVSNYMYISGIYGSNTLNNKVTYWVHD